jgi:flagellar motor protein MotB
MRVVVYSALSFSLLCSTAWAVESTPEATATPQAQVPAVTVAQNPLQTIPANKPTTSRVATNTPQDIENKKLTAEQIANNKVQQEVKVKALVKDQETRLQQLEKANLDALTQNQELQLKNDNLGVQVQVLQSERSAQMFLYGATTLAVGVLLGFLIASYVYAKRRRQW